MKPILLASLFLSASFTLQAADKPPLPVPLTLDYLLSLPAQMSPNVLARQAEQYKAQANQAENSAKDSLTISLQARLGQREFTNQTQNHHMAALHFGLPLYDFGQTQKLNQAWLVEGEARAQQIKAAENEFRLLLMQAYFNVLLADLNFRVENEATAIAFVTLDKVREDHAIGRAADVKLYEHEKSYQQAFVKRQAAQADLRRSRMLLANVMGRSDAIVSRVSLPEFNQLPNELKPVEYYLEQALTQNAEINAAKQLEQASQYRIQSARATNKPTVRADAWVGQLSSYPEIREGHWHAEISLSMPLFDSGLTKSSVDKQRAQALQAKSQLVATEQLLRDQVTNLYFQLNLLNVEQEAVEASRTFAGYNMDYKRALYENEQQSDFGDALVKISQADYDALAFELKRALLWAQMTFATGGDLMTIMPAQNKND
jgi:outer membrane protein TolC